MSMPESDRRNSAAAYEGWLYHVGVNSLGYQFCRSRYLIIKGKYVEMYTENPNEKPRKPAICGVVGSNLMVEELGRQIFHGRALYVLKIYSILDASKQGKLACSTPGEAEMWLAAFQHAKEQAEYESDRSCARKSHSEEEFRLTNSFILSHAKSYIKKPRQSVRIGKGPESLLWRPSMVAQDPDEVDDYYKHQKTDAVEQEDWKCIMTVNGLRIFEDVSLSKSRVCQQGKKGSKFMKSVGVVDATPDQIFDMIMSLDKRQRHQWDTLTGDLVLIEDVDGHSDIAHGIYDPRFYQRWCLKKDFVVLRRWRHDQDGSYSITEDSAVHKKCPRRFTHRRVKLNPTVWEITPLSVRAGTPRSLVTQIVEIQDVGFKLMRKLFPSNFQTTLPYFLLCRTAGLREFFAANCDTSVSPGDRPETAQEATSRTEVDIPQTIQEEKGPEVSEQFYDAIALQGISEEDDDDADSREVTKKVKSVKMVPDRNTSWTARLGLPSKRPPSRQENEDLVRGAEAVDIDVSIFKTSLAQASTDAESTDSWSEPGGQGFMVRGRTYMQDNLKVPGGDPLFKLLGVDWLKSDKRIDYVAKHPRSLLMMKEVKKLPFVMVVNLQIPAKPNYSLAFYFGADKPIRPGSLLHKFVTGDDTFRNSRLKLIPRIVEGYWVVKRAVGTKACLLGRALTCKYINGENYLEIDVDVGSSSVARSVCGLVLGYATSVVIDFAIVIEAQEENELPEYLLGVSRIHRINPQSAAAV